MWLEATILFLPSCFWEKRKVRFHCAAYQNWLLMVRDWAELPHWAEQIQVPIFMCQAVLALPTVCLPAPDVLYLPTPPLFHPRLPSAFSRQIWQESKSVKAISVVYSETLPEIPLVLTLDIINSQGWELFVLWGLVLINFRLGIPHHESRDVCNKSIAL